MSTSRPLVTSDGIVDARGPVFISYRQSDGRHLAESMAWALRAAGVPVWHDMTDLPPGDTGQRLNEALESGLSGAVLLITPEIADSEFVRGLELPQLLELAADAQFTLAIGTTISRAGEADKLDYAASDRLLGQPEGTLSGFNQRSIADAEDRASLANTLARRLLIYWPRFPRAGCGRAGQCRDAGHG